MRGGNRRRHDGQRDSKHESRGKKKNAVQSFKSAKGTWGKIRRLIAGFSCDPKTGFRDWKDNRQGEKEQKRLIRDPQIQATYRRHGLASLCIDRRGNSIGVGDPHPGNAGALNTDRQNRAEVNQDAGPVITAARRILDFTRPRLHSHHGLHPNAQSCSP